MPTSFSLELTARCNNACRHCYINRSAADEYSRMRELTASEIGRIAGECVEMGALWCLLAGGEPLLRPDFEAIYIMLQRMGLLLTVFTNATLIRPEHIRLFKEHPPRLIEVTVYGVSQKTYERITRKQGSYSAFRRGLDLMSENGIPVRLKAMALQSNFHEFGQIADFCRTHTSDYFRFDPFLNFRVDLDAVRNREILAERLTAGQIVTLEQNDEARFSELDKKCAHTAIEDRPAPVCDHLFSCGIGDSEYYINCEGLLQLCTCLTAPGTTYDLRRGHLRNAFQILSSRVKGMRMKNIEFSAECKRCSIRNLCPACPALAYLETGDLDGFIPYFCNVAHSRASALREGALLSAGI